MSYSFRVRFTLPKHIGIGIESPEWVILDSNPGYRIVLHSGEQDLTIKDARKLIVRGDGYATEEEAQSSGYYYQGLLMSVFARLRIGANFGDRVSKGGITDDGINDIQQHTGMRVLNDVHGLMTFKTDPPPQFLTTEVTAKLTRGQDKLIEAVQLANQSMAELSSQERLSYDLFSGSFFQPSVDARFVMLMMAIETLLEPQLRSFEVQKHIDKLIQITKNSPELAQGEIEALEKSLEGFRKESIAQSGRKLAKRLGDRAYMHKSPSKFFTECYRIRNELVHGSVPRPTWEEINQVTAPLESFVGDLLSGSLLAFEI